MKKTDTHFGNDWARTIRRLYDLCILQFSLEIRIRNHKQSGRGIFAIRVVGIGCLIYGSLFGHDPSIKTAANRTAALPKCVVGTQPLILCIFFESAGHVCVRCKLLIVSRVSSRICPCLRIPYCPHLRVARTPALVEGVLCHRQSFRSDRV